MPWEALGQLNDLLFWSGRKATLCALRKQRDCWRWEILAPVTSMRLTSHKAHRRYVLVMIQDYNISNLSCIMSAFYVSQICFHNYSNLNYLEGLSDVSAQLNSMFRKWQDRFSLISWKSESLHWQGVCKNCKTAVETEESVVVSAFLLIWE